MTTQSQYTPEVVQLQGGLDLVTPKTSAAPGSLVDCMNFEVSDVLGYSRVLGIEKFDGRDSQSLSYTEMYQATMYQCLLPPVLVSATPSATGGTLSASTWYIVVSALNAAGETTMSNQIQAITTGSTGSIAVVWNAVPGAAAYRVYFGGGSNGAQNRYVSTGSTSITLVTNAVGNGSPKTVNTAATALTVFNAPTALFLVGDISTNYFGIGTSAASINTTINNTMLFYVTNFPKFYTLYSTVASGSGCTFQDTFGNMYTATAVVNAKNVANTSLASNVAAAVTQYTTVSNKVEALGTQNLNGPGTTYNSAIGLQWYKNQLYAIADLNSFTFNTGNATIYPGDILIGAGRPGAQPKIVVRDISLMSGDWSTGNAAGVLWYSLQFPSGTSNIGSPNSATFGTANTLASVGSPGSTFSISRNGTTIANAITIATNAVTSPTPARQAGMYRSTNLANNLPIGSTYNQQGWQEIDLGYLVQFNTGGTAGPPPPIGRNSTPTEAQISTTAASNASSGFDNNQVVPNGPGQPWVTGSGTWTDNPALWPTAIQQQAAFTANGGSGTFSGQWVRSPVVASGNPSSLNLYGFSFPDLPDDVLINGVEVGVAGAVATGFGNLKANAQLIIGGANTGSVKSTIFTSNNPTTPTQSTLGGAGDFWGVTSITPAILKSSAFGVTVTLIDGPGPSGPVASALCGIYVKIYYQTSSSVYYFWNGSNDVKATIVTTNLTSGEWTGTAAGTFHVVNVQPVGSANRNVISGADQIRTLPGGAGNLLANAVSGMTYAGLPSLAMIKAQKSQYEMITANFYGNKDWEAIYGVNGAGRAFTWDGFYFRYIYTGLSNTLDLPRHLAFHNFHLCLGYNTGALFTSVTGQPESFDGTLGAAEFDTADAINGLLRMNGTTLGVFCKKSIQGLNGTDNSNFSLNILSPYEGAIEYTVVDCGKPVYASFKGISVFDQTAAYGSFLGSRLSHLITPFLLPRLTSTGQDVTVSANIPTVTNAVPTTTDNSVAFAMPIRDKNQYRLWFKDGYYVTITFSGGSLTDVSSTIQRVDFSSNSTDILIPLAHSSSIDDNGLDRNHVSYYDPLRTLPTSKSDNRNYVWEINRGWGFGTSPVRAWFTSAHNFFQNPFQIANIRKIRLHGQSLGAGTLSVAVSSDYLSNDFTFGPLFGQTQSNAVPQDISLPRFWNAANNPASTLSIQYQPQTNIANVGKEGRSFSMQFATNPTSVEPPIVAQTLLMQITENKADI